MVKYPLWIQKKDYIIRYNMTAAAILIVDNVYPRQTTANNCNTAFSLHVAKSASDDYNFQLMLFVLRQCSYAT